MGGCGEQFGGRPQRNVARENGVEPPGAGQPAGEGARRGALKRARTRLIASESSLRKRERSAQEDEARAGRERKRLEADLARQAAREKTATTRYDRFDGGSEGLGTRAGSKLDSC